MSNDNSYEEMSKGSKVYEDSESPYHNPPMQNSYEKGISGSNGLNQSGTQGSKK